MCENLVGPDPVALVMAVEEKFGLVIPDAEAEKITTMGQLYHYVMARVARGQPQVCVTSAAFYRLRRALGEVCGVPRERVRLGARLEDLIPLDDRPRAWRELRARLSNLHLPPLRRPAWLVRWLEAASMVPLLLAVLCTIILGTLLRQTPAGAFVAVFGLLACPVVGIAGIVLVCRVACRRTEKYAVHIPAACATVRDMVYALVSAHPAAPMVSDTARASDKEVWGTLCAIVAADYDRPPDSFTRDSTFT
jgi:hypothetical protein